jgi:hypothetical protein
MDKIYNYTIEVGGPQTQNSYYPEQGVLLKSTAVLIDLEKMKYFRSDEYNMPLGAYLIRSLSNINIQEKTGYTQEIICLDIFPLKYCQMIIRNLSCMLMKTILP